MNEMDLMTKIEGLEKAIAEHKDFTNTYESQLTVTKKQLVDYNKPELEPVVFDQITEAVESVLSDFDWTKLWLLPNTAGCQTAEDAIRLAFIGREIAKNLHYNENRFIKLE